MLLVAACRPSPPVSSSRSAHDCAQAANQNCEVQETLVVTEISGVTCVASTHHLMRAARGIEHVHVVAEFSTSCSLEVSRFALRASEA